METVDLFTKVNSYSDVCRLLNEVEIGEIDFEVINKQHHKKIIAFAKIQQIAKLFNGDWIPNWSDSNERKWYPYFATCSGGLVFFASGSDYCSFCGPVAYFKDQRTSDFIGRKFINIYQDLL